MVSTVVLALGGRAIRAEAERSAGACRGRRGGIQADLRRTLARRLGGRSGLLARRAAAGTLIGEITPATVIKSNTFIIWRGGEPKDFELKLEYRITPEGNSGINYRSVVIPDPVTPANKFAMRGYQCDLDGRKRYPGQQLRREGPPLSRGPRPADARHRRTSSRAPSTIGDPDELAKVVTDDWNAVHIIARGNVLTHTINGRVMSVVMDDDAANRPEKGLIGVQVHTGPPMKVEYRNIRLKQW